MFTNDTIQDVVSTSTHHEQLPRTELDPLIPRDEKGPTKKEERVARAQFLALCGALFVVGWTDGSTGPLLPRIQKFYEVSSVDLSLWPFFFNLPINSSGGVRNSVLDFCVAMYGRWYLLGSWYSM